MLSRAVDVARRSFRRQTEKPIRGAAERGDDDDGTAPVRALGLNRGLPRRADDADEPG